MNKKFFISLGLMTALVSAMVPSFADTTIYTDGIGRLHFLGRDAANNVKSNANYTNSAEQDLTRRLYENSSNDVNFVDYPVKNYENTFDDSRFSTQNVWQTKYSNNVDAARVNAKEKADTVKGSMTFEKGKTDASGMYSFTSTEIEDRMAESEKNIIKTTEKKKKHWWNK